MSDTYTTAQMLSILGVSRQRLAQLRTGYVHTVRRKDGSQQSYGISPRIIEGVDWEWIRGDVIYYPSALDKLLK